MENLSKEEARELRDRYLEVSEELGATMIGLIKLPVPPGGIGVRMRVPDTEAAKAILANVAGVYKENFMFQIGNLDVVAQELFAKSVS